MKRVKCDCKLYGLKMKKADEELPLTNSEHVAGDCSSSSGSGSSSSDSDSGGGSHGF